MKIQLFVLFALCLPVAEFYDQYVGDECILADGQNGVCTSIDDCNYALRLIRERNRPITCGFIGREPIVCCPQIGNNEINYGERSKQECEKIMKTDEMGQPFQFVIEVAGGTETDIGEFPHMVFLGVGRSRDNIDWVCGGSLVSEKFILTAAHCINNRFGTINWARLGEQSNTTNHQYIEIVRNTKHPSYDAGLRYHDIAISELRNAVEFSVVVGPACLHTEPQISKDATLKVTGWGSTDFGGDSSKDLLKATVDLYSFEECSQKYRSDTTLKLTRGIDDQIQFCAGGRDEVKDTCQGDSGGPIQMASSPKNIFKNIHIIVGITSFGKACGFVNRPGVYVRVYPYLPWIEQIVWNA